MKSKTLSTVFLSVISLVNLVPVASALEVSIGSGATQEITQENVNKLTPEQIEQAKMILPANFRIRWVVRDEFNKPMTNIRVYVTAPETKKYVTYTDEAGVFGLSLIDMRPSELKFRINETEFRLRKTPNNLSTYAFIIQREKGYVIPDNREVFWSEDIKYLSMQPIIKANPWFLGIQDARDALYVGLSVSLVIISIAMYLLVSETVSEESMNL